MISKRMSPKRGVVALVALFSSALFLFGFLDSCDDRLIALTSFVDPCGTVFANCAPGQFQLLNADLGAGCIDPECTVPGGCDTGTQPLGTIRRLCP